MINKTNRGQGAGRAWHTPQDTHMYALLTSRVRSKVQQLQQAGTRKRCAPVKYFMHLSGAFCKTFLHFLHANLFAKVVLPAHDDGHADCGLRIASHPHTHSHISRNNPANRKSATSQVRQGVGA